MIVNEYIEAKGHPNISAKNKKTFEITKENWLTERGDCIVAVGANSYALINNTGGTIE